MNHSSFRFFGKDIIDDCFDAFAIGGVERKYCKVNVLG
jgi:hypothetical protein